MHANPSPHEASLPPLPPQAPEEKPLLGPSDVERLLTEETPEVRVDVLKKIADSYSQRHYSLRELVVAEQVMRVLVRDTEVTVREALAVALKDNPQVPRDIIVSLARDVDAVAMPIIESSAVLTDADLIALVQNANTGIYKSCAIARRENLSKEVSEALALTHNARINAQLMKNATAHIPMETLQIVLQDHGRNPDVMNAMAQRPGLPSTIVEKVIALVSDTLAESLRIQYNISAETISAETEKTREIATLRLVDGKINAKEVERLVEQLQVFGRLTPSIILTSLCRGNLGFFETSLARLSHIPVKNAQLLIHDKGDLGFKALYEKAGLPEKFFAACKLLLEVVSVMQRSGDAKNDSTYANKLAQRLLAQASGRNIENLSYVIALIRQNA